MNYSKIGRKIAEKRQSLSISQEELAERVDSSANYISNLERNKRHPSLNMLVRIANELDISIDYLLLDELQNKQNVENIVLKEALKSINGLDKKDKEEFIVYIKEFAGTFYKMRNNIKNK